MLCIAEGFVTATTFILAPWILVFLKMCHVSPNIRLFAVSRWKFAQDWQSSVMPIRYLIRLRIWRGSILKRGSASLTLINSLCGARVTRFNWFVVFSLLSFVQYFFIWNCVATYKLYPAFIKIVAGQLVFGHNLCILFEHSLPKRSDLIIALTFHSLSTLVKDTHIFPCKAIRL